MTELKPFQKEGVRRIYRLRGRALLADEQGLGKTIQALYWIKKTPSRRPVLIVTPASMKWTWHAEADLHFKMVTSVIEGRRPRKHKTLEGGIFLINYEILESWVPAILKNQPETVILDEVHYCKNPDAQRTKAVMKVTENASSVIGLSGTPLTNRPVELFPILQIIRPDLFPSWDKFVWRYCKPTYSHWGWQYTGATNLPELRNILKRNVMIRRLKKDVLKELPDKTRKTISFRLPSYKEYREAQFHFLHWLRKQSPARAARAKKSQALTKVGYLLRLVAKLKLEMSEKWIADFFQNHPGEKLVALTMNTFVIDHMKEKFPKAVIVDGRVNGRDRQDVVRAFQTNPRVRLFLGNVKAAGVGLTLTASRQAVFLDLPWTPGDLMQAEDRVHRIGQKKDVIVHYLITLQTIEDKLVKILKTKASVLDQILNGGRSSEDLDIFGELLLAMRKEEDG